MRCNQLIGIDVTEESICTFKQFQAIYIVFVILIPIHTCTAPRPEVTSRSTVHFAFTAMGVVLLLSFIGYKRSYMPHKDNNGHILSTFFDLINFCYIVFHVFHSLGIKGLTCHIKMTMDTFCQHSLI